MPDLDEIEFFLYGFKALKRKHGMVVYPRDKNFRALLDLEMSAKERERVVDELEARDYYKGPKDDGVIEGNQYWEFGKTVNGKEIYIKISLGLEDGAVFCLSFHQAERPIKYPYKD